MRYFLKICATCASLFFIAGTAFTQVEVEPWGSIRGIRVGGELMEMESNISVVRAGWSGVRATAKERQRPKYVRDGARQIVTTQLDSLYFTETVTDLGKGSATVDVEMNAKAPVAGEGIFFGITLPAERFASGSVQLDRAKAMKLTGDGTALNKFLQSPVRSVAFISATRRLVITFTQPTSLIVRNTENKGKKGLRFYIPISKGDVSEGQQASQSFSITATGTVDKKPIKLALKTTVSGRVFDGVGGNFRLQNPKTDPQVIDYCLTNLRVAWSRAEMPWRFWQPAIDSNPVALAKSGKLHPQVREAMEMAQRLYKLGMPVILSAWSAPSWAIVGKPRFQPGPDGVWGNPLDHSKEVQIYQSIADYLVYLRDEYGVNVSMFSFNESDIGINIRQTGEEHAALIKGLGAYFASRGLQTKLLLGDNSDATTYKFIEPALQDAATHPYIGAVSFHSWRGWDTQTLTHWADAASALHLPLLVAEGSIDAQAWGYPAIFLEQTYALEEINLYTRLLAICQPASILQWQLTADYSPLTGGGIFGDPRPLQPTQRFWNIKQLASTPPGLKAMSLGCNARNVSVAALGDLDKGSYAIHIVNNGSTRQTTLSGLPPGVKVLQVFVTDKKRPMEPGKAIAVINGVAKFTLEQTSFTTLMSK